MKTSKMGSMYNCLHDPVLALDGHVLIGEYSFEWLLNKMMSSITKAGLPKHPNQSRRDALNDRENPFRVF